MGMKGFMTWNRRTTQLLERMEAGQSGKQLSITSVCTAKQWFSTNHPKIIVNLKTFGVTLLSTSVHNRVTLKKFAEELLP